MIRLPRASGGHYECLVPLGHGGMATVHLGRAVAPGVVARDVAIKILHPHLRAEASFVEAFLVEARLASKIRHPNVVAVVDIGDDPDALFLVMEYVEGGSLAALVGSGQADRPVIPVGVATRILVDALAGLHDAHELEEGGAPLGLVHRDFSPHNLLVGVDGVTRLTDFGIAKARRWSTATESGVVKGKTGYMAPEQVLDARSVDRRCDVWAAGVVAWELYAGRRLFRGEGEEPMTVLMRSLTEEAPYLGDLRSDLPGALADAVARALRPEREHRFSTAEEFRAVLADASSAPEDVARFVAERRASTTDATRRALGGARIVGRSVASLPSAAVGGDELTAALPNGLTRVRLQWLTKRALATAGLLLLVLAGAASALVIPRWGTRPVAQSDAKSARADASFVLHARANAPMARLELRDGPVPVPSSALDARIDLARSIDGDEIRAVSTDGRTAEARVEEGTALFLFTAPSELATEGASSDAAPAVAIPATTKPRSAPPSQKPKPASPSRSPKLPFAKSPYEAM